MATPARHTRDEQRLVSGQAQRRVADLSGACASTLRDGSDAGSSNHLPQTDGLPWSAHMVSAMAACWRTYFLPLALPPAALTACTYLAFHAALPRACTRGARTRHLQSNIISGLLQPPFLPACAHHCQAGWW